MKTRAVVVMLAAASVAFESLDAQGTGPCPFVYPSPQVGEYAELEFSDSAQGRVTMRFAVVGRESIAGQAHYWIEIVSAPPTAEGTVIAQMLVPSYPFDRQDIKGYIVKLPGKVAQRMPQQMIDMMAASSAPGSSWEETCGTARDLGQEQVTVAAGEFRARHYRAAGDDSGDVWIADVPFGMVKMIQTGSEMQLLKYGRDARSSIVEEPVEIPMNPPNE